MEHILDGFLAWLSPYRIVQNRGNYWVLSCSNSHRDCGMVGRAVQSLQKVEGHMIKGILLIAISALVIGISRKSLLRPKSHGFYRFFAWEATAVLLYLNSGQWFRDPFAPRQLVSWLLLTLSLAALVFSVISLKAVGKPESAIDDPTRIGIEKTTVLVTVGIYRYIRHPLYASVLLLAWGTSLKSMSWLSLLLAPAVTALILVTAKVEEAEDVRLFGQSYTRYMKKTKMFLPFLF
jgi:protein-S-isoprenylcysteine O-methyltransferase Ste14